ncbi:MAG: hypothetical protein ACFFDX_14655, partial [Candidatus Odinarchaeota archaeon]
MSEDSKNNEDSDNDAEEKVVKEEQSLQFHLYIILFFIIYYGSWLIPGFIFFSYVLFFFEPYFLRISNFFAIFTEIKPLLALFAMPLVLIIAYYVRLLLIGIITKIFWKITERISPSKDGIIPRNIRSKTANYYHLRSFILKYGKNVFSKGLFPWLSTWFYNFIGTSKIGKGTTIEESVGSDKFIEVGKNCYIGVNSTLSSHLLTGIFGNINYFKIHFGDNVTLASMNQIGPGTEIYDDAFMLPLACCTKHNVVKGNHNYYFGIPQRKIFKKKVMSWLDLSEEDLRKNKNPEMYIKKKGAKIKEEAKEITEEIEDEEEDFEEDIDISEEIELKDVSTLTNEDLALDFTTSSAISRINIKFLVVYLPIFWLSGLLVAIYWYGYSMEGVKLSSIIFLPFALISMLYLFILGVLLFSKLLLILVNLIHKPKEGTFLAQIRDTDYEFWMLRTELKKITLWLLRNSPLPWIDALAFRWFGISMDFSSHLNDAWCDGEFIDFGRKNLIGQGATIMSSMVVGKYLVIKRVIFDDFVLVGGHTTVAPGTIMGHDSVVGAISTTAFNQVIEPNWIYFGIPAIKLKENKYAEERRDLIIKV